MKKNSPKTINICQQYNPLILNKGNTITSKNEEINKRDTLKSTPNYTQSATSYAKRMKTLLFMEDTITAKSQSITSEYDKMLIAIESNKEEQEARFLRLMPTEDKKEILYYKTKQSTLKDV